jgi:hypothetical protein
MTRTALAAAGLVAALATVVPAAPVPKAGEKLPPPTPEEWKRSQNNLKVIGLAIHSYHDANGRLPANVVAGGKTLLSWRVLLLPFVEEDALYKQFRLDEPWDSDHNKRLIEKLPKVYAPVRVTAKAGETFYRGFDGPGAVFEPGKRLTIPAGLPDGTANTALVVEAADPGVWTKPDDVPFDPAKDLPKLGGLFDGEFNMLFGDGAVHRIRKDFDVGMMKLVIQRADGHPVDLDLLLAAK